jgi:hypothetical protein
VQQPHTLQHMPFTEPVTVLTAVQVAESSQLPNMIHRVLTWGKGLQYIPPPPAALKPPQL